MTLQVRRHDERTFVLTDHRGVALPCQSAVSWRHGGRDELATITVEFAVDGRDVVVSDAPEVLPSGTTAEAFDVWARLSPANRERFLTAVGVHIAPIASPSEAFRRWGSGEGDRS